MIFAANFKQGVLPLYIARWQYFA